VWYYISGIIITKAGNIHYSDGPGSHPHNHILTIEFEVGFKIMVPLFRVFYKGVTPARAGKKLRFRPAVARARGVALGFREPYVDGAGGEHPGAARGAAAHVPCGP
jgi:hypothetical protein